MSPTATDPACEGHGTLAKPLLSGMSHALRNSLNAVGLTLMNACRQLDKEQQLGRREDLVGQLQLAIDEVEVARATLVRFVEMARRLEPVRERVDASEVLEAAFAYERPGGLPAPARVDGAGVPPLTLACDPRLARGAVAEAIANALDAVGGEADRVRVRARRNGELARIEVEDDGPGLSEPVLARCFEPFYAGRAERQGLGLAIARRYVAAQGGSIAVENRGDGRGARVVIRLPLA